MCFPVARSFALKVRKCAWTGSVQGAVATWSVISMRYFPTIVDSHDLTRSLPLPVLTRSKCDSPLLRQSRSTIGSSRCPEMRLGTLSCDDCSRIHASLRHVAVLYADVATLEWSRFEVVNLELDTTRIKHLCDFAKVLVHAAQTFKNHLMKFFSRGQWTRQILHRLEANLQT